MNADLTILCVSQGSAYSESFVEQMRADALRIGATFLLLVDGEDLHSGGYLESVLDEAVAKCDTEYILRLDDDEQLPEEAVQWLENGSYRSASHWAFKRRNLWPDTSQYIFNPPLYPDLQTRLSTKDKAGRLGGIHAGSPFGTGEVAPVPIDHHKFLVRPVEEREALIQRYDNVSPGAGSQYVMFSVPERFEGLLSVRPV